MFCRRNRRNRAGFTLLELMLAITILSVVTVVMYMSLAVVAGAWRRTVVMSDNVNHGDFVMDQMIMGLRSAYYPQAGINPQYGFVHEDNGDGEMADDRISWVKLGSAVVGRNCSFAGTPHRIEISMEEGDRGRGIAFRAWRLQGQPEDFDKEDLEVEVLSRRVTGFNVRTGIRKKDGEDDIDWQDDWTETNRIPIVIELTLFMDPREEGGEPVEIKRICPVPCAYISWKR
jgi:prepilin-type N-terminal cleavage/methylation domain-containing protein